MRSRPELGMQRRDFNAIRYMMMMMALLHAGDCDKDPVLHFSMGKDSLQKGLSRLEEVNTANFERWVAKKLCFIIFYCVIVSSSIVLYAVLSAFLAYSYPLVRRDLSCARLADDPHTWEFGYFSSSNGRWTHEGTWEHADKHSPADRHFFGDVDWKEREEMLSKGIGQVARRSFSCTKDHEAVDGAVTDPAAVGMTAAEGCDRRIDFLDVRGTR
eukprot:757137-Hanusia_phi.AAC.1